MSAEPRRRPYFPTKAAWAEAMANEKDQAARELRYSSTAGQNYGQKRDKWKRVRMLEGEAAKYRTLAAGYRARGE